MHRRSDARRRGERSGRRRPLPEPARRFTVCVLLYGDHQELAFRCLYSLLQGSWGSVVENVKIGLNNVSRDTHAIASNWAAVCGRPVSFISPEWPEGSPALKYPVVRRMFCSDDLERSVMWFDDDSYLDSDGSDFWKEAAEKASQHKVLGQVMRRSMSQSQWQWIQRQWWADKSLPYRGEFIFPQGAWFTADTSLLHRLDWPMKQLRHCGGDAMLGELLRHQKVAITPWRSGVRINAGETGEDSSSARRGFSEPMLAEDYCGEPLPTDHHCVQFRSWSYVGATT